MFDVGIPMLLAQSNYVADSVLSYGGGHVMAAALGIGLLWSTLGLLLNGDPMAHRPPRLATGRPALQP